MRAEWFEPIQTSMAELGVVAVWLEQNLSQVSPQLISDVDGIVLELSNEVVGSAGLHQVGSWGPLAGLPVEDESAALAESLGIADVMWGENQARAWLSSLEKAQVTSTAPLLAVWGTAGAPGATTLAVGLARELARSRPVLLIDADFLAPSVGEILGISRDSSGLLAALRIARNENVPWELLRACAASEGTNISLHVLTGIRQGSLGRLEAAGMAGLIDASLAAGVAVIVDLKCPLRDSEPIPERVATEAILRRADHLFSVGVASELGVTRLVRDRALLMDMKQDVNQSILLREPSSSFGSSFAETSSALWGFTGCSDIRALPPQTDTADTSQLIDLLQTTIGAPLRPLPSNEIKRSRLRAFIAPLLTSQQREPLP